jgi:chromosomal replication initiation ATPase DnaA
MSENLCDVDGLYLSIWRGLIPAGQQTMRDIAERIARRDGLTLEQLRGRYRAIRSAPSRHEAWALMYETGRFSVTQIGKWFDGRDHSTILHGIRQHRIRMGQGA